MKKILFLMLIGMIVGLTSCKKEKKPVVKELTVENVISTDREYMALHYGGSYQFYESCIILKGYLDEENDGAIAGISNVFQYEDFDGEPFVVTLAHTSCGNDSIDAKPGFWIEDFQLNEDAINITYKEAYAKAMEANYPKPHSKNCILRKPMGPKDCNAQWVFGNIEAQIWVDAVTGDVRDSNPAFEKEEVE